MVSSATTRNRLEKIGPGEQLNSWGGPNGLNRVIDLIDALADGWVSVSATATLTSANYIADQARMRCIKYTGASSGTITIPSVEKWYWVWAVSSDVIITTGGGNTATVKAGNIASVHCDSANCYKGQDADFGGSEVTNIGTPTANASAVTKAYADGLAMAQSDLPGQNSGTLYNAVFSGGTPTSAAWRRSHPQSTSSNTGQVLKSTGTDGYPETALQWDWDAYRGTSAKTSNYTVVTTDRGKTISCTGSFTVSMTAAATLGGSFYCRVVNAGTGLITVDPNGSETITFPGQSAKTAITLVPGEAIDIFCDGANFTAEVCQAVGLCFYAYESSVPTYTISTWTTRPVSNIVINTIGVTYSTGTIQGVPPGRYIAVCQANAYGTNAFSIRLYNSTASAALLYGTVGVAENFGSSAYAEGIATINDAFDLSASSNLVLQTYSSNAVSGGGGWGGGFAGAGGAPNKYSEFRLFRVGP